MADGFKPYTTRKLVEAAEVLAVTVCRDIGQPDFLVRVVGQDEPVAVEGKVFARGLPKPGDFLVRYPDGYLSWSPRAAFLESATPGHDQVQWFNGRTGAPVAAPGGQADG